MFVHLSLPYQSLIALHTFRIEASPTLTMEDRAKTYIAALSERYRGTEEDQTWYCIAVGSGGGSTCSNQKLTNQ